MYIGLIEKAGVCAKLCLHLIRGEWSIFFPRWFWKKNSPFFNVYMSKCMQFEGLSTGIFTWTIPNHTIKLQLHRPRHLIFKQ